MLFRSAKDYTKAVVLNENNVTILWTCIALQRALTKKILDYPQLKAQYKAIDAVMLLYEFGPEVLLRFQDLGKMLGEAPRFEPSFFEDFLVDNCAYASRPDSGKADIFATWAVLRILTASRYSLPKRHREALGLYLEALAAPKGGYYFEDSSPDSSGYSERFTLEGWHKALECLAMLE